jgi:hypothetical protein
LINSAALELVKERNPRAASGKEFVQQLAEWELKIWGVSTIPAPIRSERRLPDDPEQSSEQRNRMIQAQIQERVEYKKQKKLEYRKDKKQKKKERSEYRREID